jgi:hypothetical protein
LSAKSPTLEPIFSLPIEAGAELPTHHEIAFHVSIRKIRLYGAQDGDFSPLFGPPSDFGPSSDIFASPEIGLDTAKPMMGAAGFEPATSRV